MTEAEAVAEAQPQAEVGIETRAEAEADAEAEAYAAHTFKVQVPSAIVRHTNNGKCTHTHLDRRTLTPTHPHTDTYCN